MNFICRQPNGLICRFSTVCDCPTHVNLTNEGYIAYRKEKAKNDADFWIERERNPLTHENIHGETPEELDKIISIMIQKAEVDAEETLIGYVKDYSYLDDYFHPLNMSTKLYQEYRKIMETPIDENTEYNIDTVSDGGDEDECDEED